MDPLNEILEREKPWNQQPLKNAIKKEFFAEVGVIDRWKGRKKKERKHYSHFFQKWLHRKTHICASFGKFLIMEIR